MTHNKSQNGAVSLFVVIFTALLLTIITISFVQLMLRDQQQATASDLSQSAYDSAQAGVEDAKRALLLNQSCTDGTSSLSATECARINTALASDECDTVAVALDISQTNNETLIQQDESDKKLDQAYTCVKVAVNTPDYTRALEANASDLIPLTGVSQFNSIELSWFTKSDFSSPIGNQVLSYPSVGAGIELPRADGATWQSNAPSLMRAQLIQMSNNFSLSDFNDEVGAKSNANTLFLYPSSVGLNTKNFSDDSRRSGLTTPQIIRCLPNLSVAIYACTATITLPEPVGGTAANRQAFLRLSSLYNASSYKIVLKNGPATVNFSGVQPEVDSTGRANSLFRRVKARVTLGSNYPFPQAAVDIDRDLCKNFSITDNVNDFAIAACNY